MTEPEEIEVLSIKLRGHTTITAKKLSPEQRKNPKSPHYRGDGVAVWLNKRKTNLCAGKLELSSEELEKIEKEVSE